MDHWVLDVVSAKGEQTMSLHRRKVGSRRG